jgi:hypothetical protein
MANQLEFKAGPLAMVSADAGDQSVTYDAKSQVVDGLSGSETDKAPSVASVKTALAGKVAVEAGKGLSSNDFTTAEKTKLAGLESSHFRGEYATLAALQAVTGTTGDYAYVDLGSSQPVTKYIWDTTDTEWVPQQGETTEETPASIKSKYESNANTNAYTDAEKTKLSGIAAGAEVNQNAFASVKVGTNTVSANSKTAQVELAASDGISMGASGNVITIASNAITAVKVGSTVITW